MIAAEVVEVLREAKLTVAFSESLTAGLAAATLASVPGASAVLRGGVVVYATELKTKIGGVPAEVIAEHGPVSPVTAEAMAKAVRELCGSDLGVSLTGVAGPETQDGHPVGEVWVGLARKRTATALRAADLVTAGGGSFQASGELLRGERNEIRRQSVEAAFLERSGLPGNKTRHWAVRGSDGNNNSSLQHTGRIFCCPS